MKILVCIDLSLSTETVVKKAKELARLNAANFWLIHVAEPEPDFVGYEASPQQERDSLAKRFHEEHRQIQGIADRMRKEGLDTTALLVQGPTVDTIIMEASKLDVDMIVVGSHGRGLMYQLLLGSVSEGLLRGSKYPVLVVPTHERT